MRQNPLSRLVPSAFNARKSGGEDVGELAALIKAQGLLQNLVVHPIEAKRGKSTGDYGVAAGGRRLRALGLLAKAGDIPLDKDILCRLITRDAAIAASVAENSGRAAMSVADTVTAFAEMIAAGAGVEDVAVCFGITPLTVQRRLKLAKVSPVMAVGTMSAVLRYQTSKTWWASNSWAPISQPCNGTWLHNNV